jgi:DNA adenine methylase
MIGRLCKCRNLGSNPSTSTKLLDMCAMISYFGGKSSKVFQEFINTKIPKSGIDCYVEPFSGSFATFLDGDDMNYRTVVYNDRNRHQANLYKCCQQRSELADVIQKLLNGPLKCDESDPIKKWDFYKSHYHRWVKGDFLDNNDFEIPDYKRAAIYAFLITSSHNSVYPRGAGFNGYKKDKDKLKLEVLLQKLKGDKYLEKMDQITHFFNKDFEELMSEWDSPTTYFYLDPPYFRPDEKGEDDGKRLFWYGSDTENVFGPASHRRLLELLKGLKSRWSLSYYYFPLLEELLPRDKYFWYEKEVFRSSAGGGNNASSKSAQTKGRELLILNYPV